MQLSHKSMWVKIYNLCVGLSNRFHGPNATQVPVLSTIHYNRTTDICTFLRRIFLWTPIYISIYSFYYLGIFFILSYPFFFFNFETASVGIVYTLICLGIGFGIIFGGAYIVYHTTEKIIDKRIKREKKPGILKTWMKSLKEKTCVLIKIGD